MWLEITLRPRALLGPAKAGVPNMFERGKYRVGACTMCRPRSYWENIIRISGAHHQYLGSNTENTNSQILVGLAIRNGQMDSFVPQTG
jgi:hypothetical protein